MTMPTGPFVRAVSIDYSDDELDALASAFNRPDLARRPERAGGDPVRRAQQQTALRGLVARKAIALTGSTARPRIAFLDPHATMLGTYLRASALATVRTETADRTRAVSLLADDEVVVLQEALPGQAIQRMTAHGVDGAIALLGAELRLPESREPADRPAIELTRRMINGALEAFQRREPAPSCVPSAGADLLYARVASGSVTFTSRDRAGTVTAHKWAWIDAGTLGVWQLHTTGDSPLVRFVPADGSALGQEIAAAWAAVIAAAPLRVESGALVEVELDEFQRGVVRFAGPARNPEETAVWVEIQPTNLVGSFAGVDWERPSALGSVARRERRDHRVHRRYAGGARDQPSQVNDAELIFAIAPRRPIVGVVVGPAV
ncbi:MAG: hypothetical protein JHD16_01100 [Solirubrobacteraceae bacterium]|nr:hypothetical protein [Solirubrobacteraceae bacterium]